MHGDRLKKIFGVGPLGASISLVLLAITAGIEHYGDFGAITRHTQLVYWLGGILVVLGLGLHVWSFMTLRHWWAQSNLCTQGPFRYFRHPMYAAWITFIATGFVLLVNACAYLVWLVLLHPLWHALVCREEKSMCRLFGDTYRRYAARTGRFFPRMRC